MKPNPRLWVTIQLLMTVIFLHHALQPILALAGWFDWKPKYFVSAGGGFLYGAALYLLMKRNRWGAYIAICGPLIGTTILSIGALLMWLQVIHLEFRQDLSTLLGGIPQVFAFVIAVYLLRNDPGLRRPHAAT